MDADVLPLCKAAATLNGVTAQEYISDAMNRIASEYLKRPPVKRLPPPPKPHGPKAKK